MSRTLRLFQNARYFPHRNMVLMAAACAFLIGIGIPFVIERPRLQAVDLSILVVSVAFLCVIAANISKSKDWGSLLSLSSLAFLGYPVGAVMFVLDWVPQNEVISSLSRFREYRDSLLLGLLLGFTAYLFLILSYSLVRRRSRNTINDDRPAPAISHQRLMWVVAMYAVLGIAASLYYYSRQGGLRYFIANISFLRGESTGSFYLTWVATLLPISCLLWLGLAPQHARRSPFFWGLTTLAFLYSISVGTTWTVFSFVLILVLVMPARQTSSLRRANNRLYLLVAIGLIVLAVYVLSWRAISTGGEALTFKNLTTACNGDGFDKEHHLLNYRRPQRN